jgi:hypothetical protein
MTIQETLNYLLKQLETITTVAVTSIRSNIFKVTVGNFPKTQDVKGTVIVGNLKGEMRDLTRKIEAVEKAVINKIYPDSVTVKNMKDMPMPEKVVIPEYPKEITVKNPQERVEVSNFEVVIKELSKIGKKIDSIELSPKVTVEAPQVTVEAAKAPIVKIPEAEKLFSDDPKKYIPVRLTDGEEFYEAVNSVVRSLNRTKKVEVTNGNILATFETNDVDKVSSTLLYNGLEEKDGNWCVQRVDSAGGDVEVRFATIVNNGNMDYTHAWDDRLSLVYGYFSEAF